MTRTLKALARALKNEQIKTPAIKASPLHDDLTKGGWEHDDTQVGDGVAHHTYSGSENLAPITKHGFKPVSASVWKQPTSHDTVHIHQAGNQLTHKHFDQSYRSPLNETVDIPVSGVMAAYSAIPGGNHTYSHPPIAVEPPEGLKQKRVVKNALDSLVALITQVVLTRGGTADPFGRKDSEGGVFLRIVLPAAGILAPSGVSQVLQQIQQVAFQNFPTARVDAMNIISVGLGSPVSQNDGKHILTLRVLYPLPPGISPVNNPHQCRDQNNNEAGSRLDDD
jgi:hypothetical protein